VGEFAHLWGHLGCGGRSWKNSRSTQCRWQGSSTSGISVSLRLHRWCAIAKRSFDRPSTAVSRLATVLSALLAAKGGK
jgi:hypothetical protein